ncbi:glutaredoxin-C5 [Andrographis paniculata]|uniref:glutaredoxin-C5 n=1 Tax=Andrographis paniculata TaxID=175694 RepID=UPI0021E7E4EC|nr:glutaredoxin-C5 [Andrographis paniculata]
MHYGGGGGSYKRSVATEASERIERMASASAVVIFSMSSCCMCHAVKRLFCSMGVNPTVYEIDQDPNAKDLEKALKKIAQAAAQSQSQSESAQFPSSSSSSSGVPLVFIGGKLVGAMDSVMASHISGALVPLLKEAGALWL